MDRGHFKTSKEINVSEDQSGVMPEKRAHKGLTKTVELGIRWWQNPAVHKNGLNYLGERAGQKRLKVFWSEL